jgi:hypothetical protein
MYLLQGGIAMRIKVSLDKNKTNSHGTQNQGESWNWEMVRGPRFKMLDLLKEIRQRENQNPEGGRTRAVWYKRFIYYFPSGKWWNLDVVLVRSL